MRNMEIWYLETSAINEFVKGHSIEDTLATKQLQLNKGRDWRLSPVTLWEILMTTNEVQRDKLIHYCQCLFSKELLPSVGEIIVPYIEQGMPKYEEGRKLVSNTKLADVWRNLVDDRNSSFSIDHKELKSRVKLIQSTSKDVHKLINNGDVIVGSNASFVGTDCCLSHLVNELPFTPMRLGTMYKTFSGFRHRFIRHSNA